MPDLSFEVTAAEAVPYCAAPLINLIVGITNTDPQETIESMMLRCQIQIETTRRKYSPDEQGKMLDLYGEPERWGQTLRTLLWTHVSVAVTPFTGSTTVDMPVPCTFDFNVATTKYFNGIQDGDIPLCLLFSGTIFYRDADANLQVTQIPWEKEANYRLPITVWKQMMELYYPNSAWLNIRKDVFDRLQSYKMSKAIPTWEQALESLMPAEQRGVAGGQSRRMQRTLVEKIADAVLYEGYMLYPYRASSVKNRQRFNWGALAPKSYSDAQRGTEAWEMQTECLVSGANVTLNIKVRFLQLTDREIGRVDKPGPDIPDSYELVRSLEVNGHLYQAWQEAVEREVNLPPLDLTNSVRKVHSFAFPDSRAVETLRDRAENVAGLMIRTQSAITGEIEVSAAETDQEGLRKVRVVIRNTTAFANAAASDREAALLSSIVSTHTILRVADGEFVSLLEPSDEFAAAAASCENKGAFPVLAGIASSRDCMLSSPIILYDYPEIAAESAGDLFDGAEIDEILTLRIMTMTDEEKREMRSVDDRARTILERTEMMPEEQLLKMHGAMRGLNKAKKANYG